MDIMVRLFDQSPLCGPDASALLENAIGTLGMFGRQVVRPYGEDPRPRWIRFLLDRNRVTMEQLKMSAHLKLLEFGYGEGSRLVKTGTYADHCSSPEAVGYALLHGSDDELKGWDRIRYDHGDTPDSFRRSAEGLLEDVVRQLLTDSVRPRIRTLHFPFPELLS